MEKKLRFSVLRYYPSSVSGERINLGILFSDDNTGFRSFYHTRNYSRLKKFDDELDRDVLKAFLVGIEKEVSGEWYADGFDIDKFIKYYINDYRFSNIQSISYEDIDKVTDSLIKTYFRFDFDKKDRPNKNEDQKILAELIRSAGISLSKNKKVLGAFNEQIVYDIATDDYYIKMFDFDDKDLKRSINAAKLWAWNCNHQKDKKIYIVYRYSKNDLAYNTDFTIIKNILKESNAKFISIDEAQSLTNEAV